MSPDDHRAATRAAILDATDRLLAQYGYQKMTMEDIARAAGISKRTIYLYFGSKEEVALATADRNIERLVERLCEIASTNLDPAERVRLMILSRVEYMFDRAQDYHPAFESLLASLRPVYMERREVYVEMEARVFADVIDDGRSAGSLATSDPDVAARLLILATNALLPFSLSAHALQERDAVLRQAGAMAELLLGGLRAR